MKIVAYAKHLAISPRKLRLVAATVKNQDLDQALNQLDHLPQKGAKIVKKTLNSAVANATNNFHLEKDNLAIDEIIVDEAGRYKRLDYSHGARFNGGLIQKRLSHLRVVLTEKAAKNQDQNLVLPKLKSTLGQDKEKKIALQSKKKSAAKKAKPKRATAKK
jgi:large subunit ribosomal protein L22